MEDRGFPLRELPGRDGPSSRCCEIGAAINLETKLLDQACPEVHSTFELPVIEGDSSPFGAVWAPGDSLGAGHHQCIPSIPSEMGLNDSTKGCRNAVCFLFLFFNEI